MANSITIGDRTYQLDAATAEKLLPVLNLDMDDEDEEEEMMDSKGKKKMPAFMMEDDEEDDDEEAMDASDEYEDDEEEAMDSDTESLLNWAVQRIDSLEAQVKSLSAENKTAKSALARLDSIDVDEIIAAEVGARIDAYNELRPFLPEDFQLDSEATTTSMKLAALTELGYGDDFNEDSEESELDAALAIAKTYHNRDSLSLHKQILSTPAYGKGGRTNMDALDGVREAYANAWKQGAN